LRNRFNISVAEVEAHDHRQLAVLGMAMVSIEAKLMRTVFGEIVEALRGHPVAELIDYQIEV
jgi:uncharacterized protein YlxP (DUF503 family)